MSRKLNTKKKKMENNQNECVNQNKRTKKKL